MVSSNLFCQTILLIFYFDNNFDQTECSLLSRVKNPLNIIPHNAKTAEEQVVYFELPGTLQRMLPTRRPQNIATDSSHAATSAVPEYVLYHNEPIKTASPSINIYRYVAEKPSLDMENLNRYESLKAYPGIDKVHNFERMRTMADLENDNYYEPLSPVARTTTINRHQPLRTITATEYYNQVSRTFSDLDKINRYEPIRTTTDPKILGNYDLTRTLPTLENKNGYTTLRKEIFQKFNIYQSLRTLDNINRYEPVISARISENINKDLPIRTITVSENIDQYQPLRTLPALDNNYEPVRSDRRPDSYYRYEPSRTSSLTQKTGHVNNILNFQLQQNENRDEPVRTHPSLDNIYRYEVERASLPVKAHPYLPLQTSIPQKSEIDIYRLDPSSPSPSPEYLNQYKPIKLSALYIDPPSGIDKNTSPNYIRRLETFGSLNDSVDEPVRTTPLPKIAYQLGPTSYTNNYFEPSRTSQVLNRRKEIYQFTPFLAYGSLNAATNSKDKAQFTPFLKSETSTGNVKQWKSVNTTKSPDDYWNEFMQVLPESKQINQNQIEGLTRSPTTLNVYENKERLKTLVVGGNLYQLLPIETSRAAEDYWNEFIRNEHAKTYETSPVRVPCRTAKLHNSPVRSSYEDGHLKTISLEQIVYQSKHLETAIPYDFFYQNIPMRTSRLPPTVHQYEPLTISKSPQTVHQYEPLRTSKSTECVHQYEPLRTSRSPQTIYPYNPLRTSRSPQTVYRYEPLETSISPETVYQYEPLRTSRSPQAVYQYETLRTPRVPQSVQEYEPQRISSRLAEDFYQSAPLRNYIYNRPDASSYKNVPTRSTRPGHNMYQQEPLRISTTEDDLNRNRPVRTSSPSQNFYLDEPARVSRPSQHFYHTEVIRTTLPVQNVYHHETHNQPVSPVTASESTTRTTAERFFETKARQGFKTLWQPTPTTSTKKATRTTSEENVKPTRTTKLFNWNFNDADAAWPKVELILSTTESSTSATKAKRKFATYFPFYLRTFKEESMASSLPEGTKAETTALSNATKIADFPNDNEHMKHLIARQSNEARCYSCGLNITMIPYFPSCYHIFEQSGTINSIRRRDFRVHCKNQNRKKKDTKDYTVPDNRELYRGGCFKRYIEFGDVYSERGCRTMEPILGQSFASYRLASLERVLSDVDEGCVTSPHASLTPFARGISLYARYHVCVCQGRYCNDAHMVTPSVFIALFNIFLSI